MAKSTSTAATKKLSPSSGKGKTKGPAPRPSIIAFWNNKGGTGKTSLAFQSICRYADKRPEERILALDLCPQANLSELMLGGLTNKGSDNLLKLQGGNVRSTIGGYMQTRLPHPYSAPTFRCSDFIATPAEFNNVLPENVDLVCGDPLLELQVNAMATLANNQIPGTNTWLAVMDWLRDFITPVREKYTTIFIDANPSFSIYTQMALAAAEELVLPVMADDSSRRAVQNVFSLVYGLKLPSEIYTQHAFGARLKAAKRPLPRVRLIVKNRLTQYMGPASAYDDVLQSIVNNVETLRKEEPDLFVAPKEDPFVEIRDFQTTGVVAFAKGCPFSKLESGRVSLFEQRVRVNAPYLQQCIEAIDGLVARL
jgi:cellulose biosynthesis protein BcsQ